MDHKYLKYRDYFAGSALLGYMLTQAAPAMQARRVVAPASAAPGA
jgi:hypothetical protein